jgi:hypothetical protein
MQGAETATLSVPDFTEARYRELLAAACARFRFRKLTEDLSGDGIAVWRHDIDFSPQRALGLARIEAEMGVAATYYVLLGSPSYNPFEAAVRDALRGILALGHDVGLHYDASAADAHESQIEFEAGTLSRLLGNKVMSFSLHNPSLSPGASLDQPTHAGLLNASDPRMRSSFTYCSDSNGFWRYRSLHDVVSDGAVRRLYALTHPEMWTPEPMTARARIQRCFDGRAERAAADYDAFLKQRPDAVGR